MDENFNQEIKCCMSLVIENAAFYDPEPEVENFPGLEKYLQISTQKWKRKRVPFRVSFCKYFSRPGKFSTFGQGVIKRAFSITRDINSYYSTSDQPILKNSKN